MTRSPKSASATKQGNFGNLQIGVHLPTVRHCGPALPRRRIKDEMSCYSVPVWLADPILPNSIAR